MPYEDGRRYPYTTPTQKHGKGRASSSNKQDRSVDHDGGERGTARKASGSENTTGGSDSKGVAKKPKGTPVVAPGGRNQRSMLPGHDVSIKHNPGYGKK